MSMTFEICSLDSYIHETANTFDVGVLRNIVNDVYFDPKFNENFQYKDSQSILKFDEYNNLIDSLYNNVQRESQNFNFGFLVFKNIYLLGYHSIILDLERQLCYIGDCVGWSLEFLQWHTTGTYSARWNDKNTAFEIELPSERAEFSSARTINFPGSYIYGHWLLDQVPRLFLMEQWNRLLDSPMITPHLPSFCQNFLSVFNLSSSNFIFTQEHTPLKIGRLEIPNFPHAGARMPHGLLHNAWSALKERIFKSILNGTFSEHQPELPKKIFISRSSWPTARKLPSNNVELEQLAEMRGYEIIRPESLDFYEQVRIFSGAEIIIGPDGSGLHNILFTKSPACLGVIDWASRKNLWHVGFCESLGHKIAYLDTILLNDGDQIVDLQYFAKFLDYLEIKNDEASRALASGSRQLARSLWSGSSEVLVASTERHRNMSVTDLAGRLYTDVLQQIHSLVNPDTYLEVGTRQGDSLRLSRCPSIAIDPSFELQGDIFGSKNQCFFFKMTSDKFFSEFDPVKLLGKTVDLSFLDGLHLFEFLLRDFINIERNSARNSIVMLHDCIPSDVYICERDENDIETRNLGRHPEWWAGDVWKLIPILKKYRPDLRIYCFDAQPTGLVMITNLNPLSSVLSENYFSIVEDYKDVALDEKGLSSFFETLNLMSVEVLYDFNEYSKLFWL